MKKPQPMHSILEKTLKALEIDGPLKSYSVLDSWKEIVGDSLALQTQPRVIRNRILFIDVSHSTWMQQLHFLKPTLLEKINVFLGEPLIQDLRFKLGKISPPNQDSLQGSRLEDEKLDQAASIRIETIVQKIEDKEVQKGVRDVLIQGAKLEQYRKKSNKGSRL